VEHVILVDEHDAELGTMEKLEAHQKGMLHRAFRYYFSIQEANYCCSNDRLTSITVAVCGQTLVAAIRFPMKICN
jgi:hypothetical protein